MVIPPIEVPTAKRTPSLACNVSALDEGGGEVAAGGVLFLGSVFVILDEGDGTVFGLDGSWGIVSLVSG